MSYKKKKILIVDDDHEFHNMLNVHLKVLGHDTVGVYSIRDAKEEISNPEIGLILLDLNFTRQAFDGTALLSVLHSMKQQQRDIPPVVVMSSLNDKEIVDYVMDDGACAFLAKPYKFDTLDEVVSAYCL